MLSEDHYLKGFEFGLEKDYNCIKTKETEDNIERKRLRTENKLLRQRIEKLEEETSTLADRLIQDQVKYANQAEELYVLRRKSLLLSDSVKDGAASVISPDLVSPGKNTVTLQAQIDEMVAKEVSLLSEKQELEMKVYDLEKHLHRKTYENRSFDLNDLQEQLMLSKLREAETSTTAKELEQKVVELDKFWQKHQEIMNCGDDKPKVQKAKIQVLTEELMSSKLKEANLVKDLMELKLKVVDLETKFHVEHRLVKKLEEENEDLKQKLSEFESGKLTYETEIRGLQRQVSKAEAKQQNDDLMTKIKDAEISQMIAELKQKIAQLEIQNQELVTAEKLHKGAENDGDDDDDLVDSKIEELHQQMVHLLKLKKDKTNGRTNQGKVSLNSLKRFYSVESDSDFDDFDSIKYKLGDEAFCSRNVSNGQKFFGGSLELNGVEKEPNGEGYFNGNDPLEMLMSGSRRSRIRSSVASNCSSLSLNVQDSATRDSPESDFSKEDILTGSSMSHDRDIILDFVLTDEQGDKYLDLTNDFIPINQSSPVKVSQSCNAYKKSEICECDSGLEPSSESNSSGVACQLSVLPVDDPGKTPTNDLSVDSDSSSHFDFNSSNNNTIFLEVKNEKMADSQPVEMNISSAYFPDLLSVSNTLSEIVRNDISSLIAGLDLPDKRCDKSVFIDTEEKSKVISDRNLSSSLDILSRV